MKILVSNDDGIDATGINVLAEALGGFGEVCIVAPDRERSGAGHSLTLHRPIRIFQRGERKYAVDGTPTDCVMLGILEVFKGSKPDLIVSGINHGANLGDDVTYSGTVSAALEGTLLGIPSIAFSLVYSQDQEPNFGAAATFAKKIVGLVVRKGIRTGTLLNVNVPNTDELDLQYEITKLGKRRFMSTTIEKMDPRGKKYYWIGGEEEAFETTLGTDSGAISRGKISVTPIKVDFTDVDYLSELKTWNI